MTCKGYTLGTHRLVPPTETLARITPLLPGLGITRAADVTGLDDLGVPVFCAIRPRGILLQVSNGKGLREVDARVSALMEGLELWHAEHPPAELPLAARAELRVDAPVLSPAELPWFRGEAALAERLRMHWVRGEELAPERAPVWLPASAAWSLDPSFYAWSTNGLASGNSVDEATLHALLEVYERHALSCLVDEAGDIDFGALDCLSFATAPGAALAELRARLAPSGVRVVLLRVAGEGPIHVCMAVLLDPRPFAAASMVNLGYGAHLSCEVAAVRAITEAAQSRLTFIHGSREDLTLRAYQGGAARQQLFDFFAGFEPDREWSELADASARELESDLAVVLGALRDEGLGPIRRVVLSAPDYPVAVVKVLVSGARMELMLAG